jgi:tetratricopeptide (TPR) repeat protein
MNTPTAFSPRNPFLHQIVRGGRFGAPLAALFGFVADVLKPLGPINGMLFVASLCAFLALSYQCHCHRCRGTFNARRRLPEQALIFNSFLLLGFGIWFALELVAKAGERGVVADHVPAVAALQDRLRGITKTLDEITAVTKSVKDDTGAIRKDMGAIRADTMATRDASSTIARNTTDIAEDTAALAAGFTDFSERFSRVGERGLINKPASPADFYHNAKFQELSGRYREAFESYQQYMAFDQEFMDPCLDYLELLRSQRGQSGADAEMARLAARFPANRAVLLTVAWMGSGEAPREGIPRFMSAHESYGPAYWLAAKLYSAEELGVQSLIAVDKEKRFLQELIARNSAGDFSQFFLDKRYAWQLVAAAKSRLAGIKGAQGATRVKANRGGADGSVLMTINDRHVKSVKYSWDNTAWVEQPDRDLMFVGSGEGRAFFVRPPAGKLEVYVQYRDTVGLESDVVTTGLLEALFPTR